MAIKPCGSCGAPVYWLKNLRTNRPAPINADPDPAIGNCVIDLSAATYGVFGPREAAEKRAAGEQLHTNHFQTCPQAKTWKKAGRTR